MPWIRKGDEPKPKEHECRRPWAKLHRYNSIWECPECNIRWVIKYHYGLGRSWDMLNTRAQRMHEVEVD